LKNKKLEFGWPNGNECGVIKFNKVINAGWCSLVINKFKDSFAELNKNDNFEITSLHDTKEISGSYKIQTTSNCWFMRISSRIGFAELEKTITNYANKMGCDLNPIISTLEFEWNDENYRADIRPYIDGRHYNNTLSDIEAVARSLSKIHSTFKDIPSKNDVCQNQMRISKNHGDIINKISIALDLNDFSLFLNYEKWACTNRNWLKKLVKSYTPNFYEYKGAQVLHGQPHTGNVVFQQDSGKAILVDTETCAYVYAPPEFDLAYFVQRFILNDNLKDIDIKKRLYAVEKGYSLPLKPLSNMMQQLSWYSIVSAFHFLLTENVSIPLEELNKFVQLEYKATQFDEFLFSMRG
jgi:hypothetical protein